MKFLTVVFVIFVFFCGAAHQGALAFSDGWSSSQKEAWRTIEDHWKYLIDGDVEKFLGYIHNKFTGFGHESPLMIDKASIAKWVGFWTKNTDIPVYELNPVNVAVYDNFAVIHYYIFALEIGKEGSKRTVRRYTTTLINEEGKWFIIGNQNQLMNGNY